MYSSNSSNTLSFIMHHPETRHCIATQEGKLTLRKYQNDRATFLDRYPKAKMAARKGIVFSSASTFL
jgi:hypothetical protein